MAEQQTPETPPGETPATPTDEPPAAPDTNPTEEAGDRGETNDADQAPGADAAPTPEAPVEDALPRVGGGAPEGDPPPEIGAEGAAAAAPEAPPQPRVFAFSCPNGQAVTFIAEGGHGDGQHAGGPVIPRDVRCPVCGHNMVIREPFDLATASQVAEEIAAPV